MTFEICPPIAGPNPVFYSTYDSPYTENVVFVSPNSPQETGKSYKTLAAAMTYAMAQTPSLTAPWCVKFSHDVTESVVLQDHVTLDGMGVGTISGAITSQSSLTPNPPVNYEYAPHIINTIVDNIVLAATPTFAFLRDCKLTGGTPLGGFIFLSDCTIVGGDYTLAWFMYAADDSKIIGGKFGNVTVVTSNIMKGSVHSLEVTGDLVADSCYVSYSGVTQNTGSMTFRSCFIGSVNDAVVGVDRNFYNCHINDGLTYYSKIQTTDATVTDLISIELDEGDAINVEIDVIGHETDESNRAQYKKAGLFYRNTGGNVTRQGAETIISVIESNAAWDCTLEADTTNQTVDVRVTGASTVDWQAFVRCNKVGV